MKHSAFVFMLLWMLAAPAQAASLLGTWAAEPDGKGQVGHVEMLRCGAAFCGTIVRAFDRAGQPVITANVGRQILRGLNKTGPQTYGNGTIYVPIFRRDFTASLSLHGNTMKITACNALSICRTQTWTRVK